MEENILKNWDDNRIFEAVQDKRKNGDEFVFYDGPPFANGQPHYGHIFVSYVKDTIARFQRTGPVYKPPCREGIPLRR